MTSITQASLRYVQELGTFLGPQNRTQSIYYTELKMLKCLIPASASVSRDAVQASGDAQVPGVRQVRVRRRGDAGGRPEVAQGELSLVSCNSTRL